MGLKAYDREVTSTLALLPGGRTALKFTGPTGAKRLWLLLLAGTGFESGTILS